MSQLGSDLKLMDSDTIKVTYRKIECPISEKDEGKSYRQ